jgi:hypothetical protein
MFELLDLNQNQIGKVIQIQSMIVAMTQAMTQEMIVSKECLNYLESSQFLYL